jgi:hypothetical protein
MIREHVQQGLGHGRGGFPQPEEQNPPRVIQRIFAPIHNEGMPAPLDKSPNCGLRFDCLHGGFENADNGRAFGMAGERVREGVRLEHTHRI